MKRLIKPIFTSISLDDIPEANKGGNCFKVAVDTLMSNPNGFLVHGVVTGQGAIDGVQYCHAWVEIGDKVIDNTVPIIIDKHVYYAIGNIQITRRYSYKEALEQMLQTETYGPWDRAFDNYL